MQVLLAKPRGFCAGVDRAIEIVERALSLHGAPIYVRHEVVHNVEVAKLRTQGREIVMIGHQGHPEVEGTMGQAQGGGMYLVEKPADVATLEVKDENSLAFVTQTTLSVDDASQIIAALRARFP